MWDILFKNGHVVDPKNGRNDVMDVAVENGRIAAVGRNLSGRAKAVEDLEGLLLVPGIIDAHMHLGKVYGSLYGARMTALSGVTTCLDMAGPLEEVLKEGHHTGAGLNVAILDRMEPSELWKTDHPERSIVEKYMETKVAEGALGIKLVGGHWPLSVETCRDTIELANEKDVYVAWHAGSKNAHSDIIGMKQAVETAGDLRLHLAHINSYCRGRVRAAEDEANEALNLLRRSPNIWSEAYMSPLNGTHLTCVNGEVKDYVTRCCLEIFKLPVSEDGIREAFRRKILVALRDTGYITEIIRGEEAERHWQEKGTTNVVGCFPVNAAVSRLMLVQGKRDDGTFVVDAMSTDGGCIPRNVIVPMGINLVKFGAITLPEFVLKASLNAARHLHLADRGHLTEGARADLTVIDYEKAQAVATYVNGAVNMKNGVLYGADMTVITTERGVRAVEEKGYRAEVVNLSEPEAPRMTA